MSTEIERGRTSSGWSVAWSAVAVFLGISVTLYGVLVLSASALGGVWIVATGVALLLSGVLATAWAAEQFALDPRTQRLLVVAFAVVAVFLGVSFVLVNGMTFEQESVTSGGA